MNVKKKIIPLICLMSAYVHWIKPRLLSASASKGGKTLLLHLCARSRFLIPMIVFTAFWMFDAQMQIEASISLSLNRNVRIIVGTDGEQRRGDRALEDNDDDAPDDDDSYSIDSYSDVSAASELSVEYDNISTAIQEFVENDVTTERFTFGGTYSYQQQ